MRLVRCTAIAMVAVGVVSGASAATYLVCPDGTGEFPTMAAAIEAAQDGDVIELADGVFVGPGNRDLTVSKQITLRSQGGDPSLCVIDCEGSPEEPHYGFVLIHVRLEGVTVTNAYTGYGSGAVSVWSDASMQNCVVRSSSTTVWVGAAVYCGGSPTFDHCWFVENGGPGAVRVEAESSAMFEGCHFVNNVGVACYSESAAEFVDCVFAGGSLGGYCAVTSFGGDVSLAGCTVMGFAPPPPGGGTIAGYEGSGILIENSIIALNRGSPAFYCQGSVTVQCSDVYGNEGGDWVGCIDGQLGQDGNICLDPQFCSEDPGLDENWQIQSDSPCAPAQSACGLIGAVDVGCGSTPVEQCTWGGVKLLFTR